VGEEATQRVGVVTLDGSDLDLGPRAGHQQGSA
jgi:hypothetical protein